MSTHTELQINLEQFDEIFIKKCKEAGLSERETIIELHANPSRKLILEALNKSFELDTKVLERIIDKGTPV